MDPVGPQGEFLLDYSVFDALRAGFETLVFVIRRDIEADFRQLVGRRWEALAEVRYVHQRLDDLPGGRRPPPERTRPWGTGQAVWAAHRGLGGPFGVVNADDFYGRSAFMALAAALDASRPVPQRHVLIAYDLWRTLSEHGSVSRGVCRVDADGLLAGIREHVGIARGPDGAIRSSDGPLADDTPVSMNLLGFQPSFLEHLEGAFEAFLARDGQSASSEFYIPSVVNALVADGLATVAVRRTDADWFGVTHAPDRPGVVRRLEALVRAGVYPGPAAGGLTAAHPRG